ncbi:hypothetical protein JR316_0009424 [Psilocybe cubensis]|uniref:Uncharacterized protein n=2 Tax=Psilocybe cubensis TaxID=181762 RepID=A0A8H7XWX6_PSICU|nr:hypothetical protein JR316_0009424 [Psilocybe cubensis]KAH9478961.1 hypothetical protein JR316_0009424 [Psilocybe cubensis]
MKFTAVLASILASASVAMSATIVGFAGADCTGARVTTNNVNSRVCLSLGSGSVKSISYSGVGSSIQFYVSGGAHDSCTNGSQLTRGAGSGCATAPAGFNWQSVAVF